MSQKDRLWSLLPLVGNWFTQIIWKHFPTPQKQWELCRGVLLVKSRGFSVKRPPKCCPKNRRRYCAKRKGKCSGGKWRGCGNPCIRTDESDGLSPPDNSPSDKCGQAAEEPASAAMGCRTAIRMKLAWAKWGSEAVGPQAEKLRQQQRSFQLLLAKPLKKFTRRHSPHSANIGYSTCILVRLKSQRAHVSGTSTGMSMARKQLHGWQKGK